MHVQRWTTKKILCYSLYRLVAKHISYDVPLVGNWGHRLRRVVCRSLFLESAAIFGVGQEVDFDNGCFIRMRECTNIGDYSILVGSHGTITIGRHVMMGKHCIILNQNHRYLAEGYEGFEGGDVIIDDYAWLGHRVIVLPGVRIGRHAIIGAGAVVCERCS